MLGEVSRYILSMVVIRIIAIMAWLVTSTLSSTAISHAAMDGMAGHKSKTAHHEMMATMKTTSDHLDMMMHHGSEPGEEPDCDESCCDGLCLCKAAPAPAVITPAVLEMSVTNPDTRTFQLAQTVADPSLLDTEGPPPRLV